MTIQQVATDTAVQVYLEQAYLFIKQCQSMCNLCTKGSVNIWVFQAVVLSDSFLSNFRHTKQLKIKTFKIVTR